MAGKRLFDYLYDQLEKYPQEKAFGHKVDGQWVYFSTRQIVDMVNRTSLGLLDLDLRPGDKVATVVNRCSPQWVALDFAMAQLGIINVPMYPTISPREYEYILNEAEVKICFAGDEDLYRKVRQAQANVPSLREIFTFYDNPNARRWDAIQRDGDLAEVKKISDGIQSSALYTLIYTSGTTGNPKGVMLTHDNITYNVEAVHCILKNEPGDRVLSFLPVSHVFERVAVYWYTAYGASVSFTGTDNLGGETGDLQTIRPHYFTTVPRLLEKVYEKIYSKGLELKGAKRGLFFWALKLADAWQFDQQPAGFQALKWKIADKLIFSKWRKALGGNIKGIITGASACPMKIMQVFNAAGITIREGYGLTEIAPGIAIGRLGRGGAMLGTIGPVLDGTEVRFEPSPDFRPDEGEILAKSPGVMLGYYKQPEKTAEMIREINGERWLATGDVGKLVDGPGGQKFLKITDRKKELLKTSLGKYVAPAPIEAKFKEHYLVEQIMVVGDNHKFVTALIVPAAEGLKNWCERNNVAWTNLHEAIQNQQVMDRYQRLLDQLNPEFSHAEQIKKFALLDSPWEPVKTDGTEGELTPTMKLKRRVILKKFQPEIEQMYV